MAEEWFSKVTKEMATEMSTPVTLIKGYVDLLEKRIRDGSRGGENLSAILDEIREHCRRAVGIADSLKDFLSGENRQQAMICSTVDLTDRLDLLFAERLKKLDVKYQVHHEDRERRFWCRHLAVLHILVCLLIQALERVQRKSVRGISILTYFTVDEHKRSNVVIRVQDSGPSRSDLPRTDFDQNILSLFYGTLELVESSFGACLELRFPIEIKKYQA